MRALALAVALCAILPWGAQAARGDRHYLLESGASTSDITIRGRCNQVEYQDMCRLMASYYSRRYEREVIMRQGPDDGAGPQRRQRSVQFMTMELLQVAKGILAVHTTFRQREPNAEVRSFIEAVNLGSDQRPIGFESLFENPSYAAMLCARAIEREFEVQGAEQLPLVVAATETEPRNFLITESGLRFFFMPDTVSMDTSRAESIDIPIESLYDAGPNEAIWATALGNERRRREMLDEPQAEEIIEEAEAQQDHKMTPQERSRVIRETLVNTFQLDDTQGKKKK